MFLFDELRSRCNTENPVRVGLIGAGKFGSMFLAQVPTTAGLEVSVIADLDPVRAKKSCANVGWSDELISRTEFVDDAMMMMMNCFTMMMLLSFFSISFDGDYLQAQSIFI